MSERERALCAEEATARGEPLGATASFVEHWLLIEYSGYWPYDPLDATVFAGRLREHLTAQLASLSRARLLLIKQTGRSRRGPVRVVYGSTPERGGRFLTLELDGHPDLLDLDVASALRGEAPLPGETLEHPLLLVCTHGKRDRCCARYGRPLCAELHERADGWAWQSSHIGGDRFAGNLVCLPEGLYFGRVAEADVDALLRAYLAGRIDLERYRGRCSYPFYVQAAELDVRRRTGLDGLHDLALRTAARTGPNAWSVELLAEVSGAVHEVDVELELEAEPAYLTCRAESQRQARRFAVRAHRVVDVAR